MPLHMRSDSPYCGKKYLFLSGLCFGERIFDVKLMPSHTITVYLVDEIKSSVLPMNGFLPQIIIYASLLAVISFNIGYVGFILFKLHIR